MTEEKRPEVLLKSGQSFREWNRAFAAALVDNLNRKTTAEAREAEPPTPKDPA